MRLFMTTDAMGGVWRYSLDAARALEARGVEVTLAVIGPDPTPDRLLDAAGLHLIATGLPLDWDERATDMLPRSAETLAALAEGYDVVHLNQPAFAAAAEWPAPVLAVGHSCIATWWQAVRGGTRLPPYLAAQADQTRAGLRGADLAAAPTHAFAEALAGRHRLARPPAVIRNGRAPVATAAAEPQDAIVGCGRLWDQGKNYALIDAVADRLPMPLHLFGPVAGPKDHFRARHARLHGEVSSRTMTEALARRPVFVAPSLYEPFGLAVLEAAQAGCALVLADIPTFRELWEGAAIFADPRDGQAWVEALAGPIDRVGLGEAARARAADYSLDRFGDALHAAVSRLAA